MTVTLKNGERVHAGLIEDVDDIRCARVYKYKNEAYVHYIEAVLIYMKVDDGWKLHNVRTEVCA